MIVCFLYFVDTKQQLETESSKIETNETEKIKEKKEINQDDRIRGGKCKIADKMDRTNK